MMPASRNRNCGFTLLEVMVALAIIGIALVVILGLAQRSILVNQRLQQMTHATLLAKQRMAEIETGLFGTDSRSTGTFNEPNQNFNWRAVYSPTAIDGIEQIDLSVLWGDEKENEFVTLTSFVRRGQR